MKTAPAAPTLHHDRSRFANLLPAVAPFPALALGVVAMRSAGAPRTAWMLNLAAGIVGLLIFAVFRFIPAPSRRRTCFVLAAAGIGTLVMTFVASGADGVHRWLAIGGLRIHAASIVAPVIICAAAAIARMHFTAAAAIAAITTAILALQPDAAQATSFAAACITVFLLDSRRNRLQAGMSVALLAALAMASFVRPDPLPPVPHVEGIFALVANGSAVRGALGAIALLLLPLPFFLIFRRRADRTSLACGVYVALITLAPLWGTFPVPVMGYGLSPIIGYFTALALCTSVYRPGVGAVRQDPDGYSGPGDARRRTIKAADGG
jgi:hypothetical protein